VKSQKAKAENANHRQEAEMAKKLQSQHAGT
jgi:hypothetical protein